MTSDAPGAAILDWHSGARRWLRAWAVSGLVWTALWAYLIGPTMWSLRAHQRLTTPWQALPFLTDHWISALLTPVFLVVAWRLPLDRRQRWRSVPRLLLAMAAFAALDDGLCLASRALWLRLGVIEKTLSLQSVGGLVSMYLPTVFTYAQIVAVGWALHYQRAARQKEVHASQLEARLAQSRLDALRMQVHPHFLFNTLNTIAALIRHDPDAAERMIARLGELLRHSLANAGGQESTVKEELELTERYLEIERARFGDRLHVAVKVDPDALDALVPRLILQPLVENAIRHGIGNRIVGGSIMLDVRREGAQLSLRVSDDGIGLRQDRQASSGSGVGLRNTRLRLEVLYGAAAELSLAARPGGGAVAALLLPFRTPQTPPQEACTGASGATANEDATLEAVLT